jgi:hypothetical protein
MKIFSIKLFQELSTDYCFAHLVVVVVLAHLVDVGHDMNQL